MHDQPVRPASQMLGVVPAGQLQRLGQLGLLALGGGRVRIAAIGTYQPVDHQLEHAWRLVPVHRREDDDAVGGSPFLVDFSHPVVGLARSVVGIATARPVTQRHGGGHAGLAGVDVQVVAGGQQTQVEQIHLDTFGLQNLPRPLGHAEGLGDLAGTAAIVARRTTDQQYPRAGRWIALGFVGQQQAVAGSFPLHRQQVVGVGKAGARFCRQRRLVAVAVVVPGNFFDFSQRTLDRIEGRVGVGALELQVKLCAPELGGRLAKAWRRGLRHAASVGYQPPGARRERHHETRHSHTPARPSVRCQTQSALTQPRLQRLQFGP